MLIETQADVYICVFQVRIRSAFHVSSIYAIIPVNDNTHASPVCTLTQSWSNSLLVSCFSVSSNETTFCLLELSHSSLAEVLLNRKCGILALACITDLPFALALYDPAVDLHPQPFVRPVTGCLTAARCLSEPHTMTRSLVLHNPYLEEVGS